MPARDDARRGRWQRSVARAQLPRETQHPLRLAYASLVLRVSGAPCGEPPKLIGRRVAAKRAVDDRARGTIVVGPHVVARVIAAWDTIGVTVNDGMEGAS